MYAGESHSRKYFIRFGHEPLDDTSVLAQRFVQHIHILGKSCMASLFLAQRPTKREVFVQYRWNLVFIVCVSQDPITLFHLLFVRVHFSKCNLIQPMISPTGLRYADHPVTEAARRADSPA